jgi:hypothetical protein
MGASVIVRARRVNGSQAPLPVQRQQIGESGIESEEAVEIENAIPGGSSIVRPEEAESWPLPVVGIFRVGNHDVEAIRAAPKKDAYDDVASVLSNRHLAQGSSRHRPGE